MPQTFSKMQFSLSAPKPQFFPAADRAEIAFAGRSNAGKSSALNLLCGRKKLARTSKTPGRTQAINFFEQDNLRFADLPGYGFAKVSTKMRVAWKHLVESYLAERENLCGIVLVMDIRHPLKEDDLQLLKWGAITDLNVLLLLTKADKLAKNKRISTLRSIQKQHPDYSIQMFSAPQRMGLESAVDTLNSWHKKDPE